MRIKKQETRLTLHEHDNDDDDDDDDYIILLLPVQTKKSKEDDADYENSHIVIRTHAEVNKDLRALLLECF